MAGEAPILKTLTIDNDTGRVRDIRPDENAKSMWDEMGKNITDYRWQSSNGQFFEDIPRSLLYTEADALEESILFPENTLDGKVSKRFNTVENDLTKFEDGRLQKKMLARFVGDLDTDDEVPSDIELLLSARINSMSQNGDQYVTEYDTEDDTEDEDGEDNSDSWEDASTSSSDIEPELSSRSTPKIEQQQNHKRYVFCFFRDFPQ